MTADLFPAEAAAAPACDACQNWRGGIYRTTCRQCVLRDIARGPAYFESQQTGKLTRAYRAQLAPLGDIKAVHAEVQQWARRLVADPSPTETTTV